jgi:hypothetical protein
MPEVNYAVSKSKLLKVKHDRILQIIKDEPGIGIDRIFEILHGSNPVRPIAKRKQLLNTLTLLCSDRRLTYISSINGYTVQAL